MQYSWKELYAQLDGCRRCPLCEHRTNIAIGEGDPHALVMFVGEGPGGEEDRLGRPFVGPAGKLLDKMLAAIDVKRESVYIANIVKCRPPGNRTPAPEEAEACLPFLRAQTALVAPKIIVCLGAVAAKYIYSPEVRISRERGKWIEKKGVWILPTYHPAALLRDESKKREAWEDFKSLKLRIESIADERIR
ncbi:MAG: uracil-DNA glycosylase [Bacillota bacterium]